MSLELTPELREVGLTAEDLRSVAEACAERDDAPLALAAFQELAPLGSFPARELVRHPGWLGEIASSAEQTRDANSLLEAIRAGCEGEPLPTCYRILRETKRRESLAVFLGETRGRSVRETAAGFADIAEATLTAAVTAVDAARFDGTLADKICVLGMGKLGGRELNPSSDVDVIFVCDDEAASDDALRVQLTELAQGVVDAMNARTVDGYVFRVDLRLRPDGTQGPIVMPLRAMVNYYLEFGQTWERSAFMKARPVAGNLELGQALLDGIEPFVYRRYLDFGALEQLREMKAKIEANASLDAVHGVEDEAVSVVLDAARAPLADRLKRRLSGRGQSRRAPRPAVKAARDKDDSGVLGWDLKIGVGGIREIEFFVQALQLVHCGAQPKLRSANTLGALDALLWAGLVPDTVHAQLTDAYDFLRRLEHRIQMSEDRQTHRLPSTWAEFDRLAARAGFERATLCEQILGWRETVRSVFERLFSAEEREASRPTLVDPGADVVDLVVRAGREQLQSAGVRKALRTLGFRRPRQVAGQVQVLREKKWGPFREGAWGGDLELARRVVTNAGASPDPDQAFSQFSRFAQAVGGRPGYWSMLGGNPHTTRLLLQVFGSSAYLSSALIADPNVFERLLGVGTVAVEKGKGRLQRELQARLHGVTDPEHRIGVIRRFHREETLRVGLHETGGAARVEQTLSQLSFLAEVVIDAVLLEVYEPLRTRRRRPGSVLPPLEEIGFAVVAMGKLGGGELGFGSDLDIVFVYREDRQWKLEHTFYARIAQRLIRTLSAASAQGKLYEVDTRLRPSGSRGALVVSADAFEDYYRSGAGVWERQALVRARPIAGPPALQEQIARIRDEIAFGEIAGEEEIAEIARMRDRVAAALYKRGSRDVKFGPGGLVDIEFATQAAQLSSDHRPEQTDGPPGRVCDGVRSQSTRAALIALGEGDDLVADYLWLCRLQARLRMSGDAMTNEIPTEPDALLMLARRMGHQGEGATEAFSAELDATLLRTRAFSVRVLGSS